MGNDLDLTKMDFDAAFRAAKRRAHAERAKESRRIFGALTAAFRDLFHVSGRSAKTDAC
ncbi:MAG: hypothetical protein AAF317_09975 [Pseudomonadota bacterium]